MDCNSEKETKKEEEEGEEEMSVITTMIVGGTCLLVLFGFATYFYLEDPDNVFRNEPVYYGPVPEGYNETHFRKTGETIPLG